MWQIFGVEAGGRGLDGVEHCASMSAGRPGVLHGNRTYLLQNDDGQILDGHSISAGLDYPGVGPEHAGCAMPAGSSYVPIIDDEALEAFQLTDAGRRHHPGAGIRACDRPRDEARAGDGHRTRSSSSTFRAAATRTCTRWRACSAWRSERMASTRIDRRFAELRQRAGRRWSPTSWAATPITRPRFPSCRRCRQPGPT